MNRRTFAAALAAVLAAVGVRPRVLAALPPARLPEPEPSECLSFSSDYVAWAGWTAPGVELPRLPGLLRVRPALAPGELSTVQVGHEGNVWEPPVPLTPAMWAAILAGLAPDSRGFAHIYTLSPAEARHWLDPRPADD